MRYEDGGQDDLTVEECAARLRITADRVMELVEQRVLRSFWDGVLWVQPALIAGVTT
ncbi:MAG: hypothetical protein K2X97_01830 [Mycobacteriaceae bacterium]|nr:hypothetical protein [Mycobacteriaceae bacterium]